MNENLKKITLFFIFLFLLLITGLRFEVGGDWFNFLSNYEQLDSSIWGENLFFQKSEPIYDFILKISRSFNLSLAGLNIMLSFFLISSIFLVASEFKNPLLVILISVPYIIIVFGMGYINQSTAFAFIIFAIYFFYKKKYFTSLLLMLFSIGFHYSAAVFLPVYFILYLINKGLKFNNTNIIIFFIIFLLLFLLSLFLFEQYYKIYKYYLNPNLYTSPGAYIRLFINSIIFFLFFLFYKDLNLTKEEKIIYLYTFFIFIICAILLFSQSSTASDRLNLYVYLIHLFVLPKILELKILQNYKSFLSFVVLIIYGFVLIFWLQFANHKNAWVPYQMFFFNKYPIEFRIFP